MEVGLAVKVPFLALAAPHLKILKKPLVLMRIMVVIKGSRTVSNQEYVLKRPTHAHAIDRIPTASSKSHHFGPFLDPPGALSKA